MAEKAEVSFDASLLSADDVAERIDDLGYEAKVLPDSTGEDQVQLSVRLIRSSTLEFYENLKQIRGMTCASCVHTIESQMSQQKGIIAVAVSLATGLGTFTYNPDLTGPRTIIEQVEVRSVLD